MFRFALPVIAALMPIGLAQAEPPAEPRAVEVLDGPGQRGGRLTTLISREKDVRLLVVYGYARLVGYDEAFNISPDILRDVEVEDERVFTLHLREGHKWSDGAPFTSEDFRYWWQDIATNEQMFPVGPPIQLVIDGERPQVSFPDALTVRYEWSKPNPFFLPALAAASPMFIYMPAHYLRQFHEDYADAEALQRMVDEAGARNWADLHGRRDEMYDFINPELPTLQPWRVTNTAPTERFVAMRNDYFHRVDQSGTQLPYADEVVMSVVASDLVPVKAGAGETDLQGRHLSFADTTFLKENAERAESDVYLWQTARGSQFTLYPNLNVQNPKWRELIRDARFRRALSLGLDREQINQVLYYGLGITGHDTVLPDSPIYQKNYRDNNAQFDPEAANALLDEIGLTKRNSEGTRLLPNGEPMEIIVESAGEESQEADILELVADSYQKLGIKLFTKPSQREVLRNRVFSGETVMAISYGSENAIITPDMSPEEFVPTQQIKLQWPMWGQYYETKGEAGVAPDIPEAKRLMTLFDQWKAAESREQRVAAWEEILAIHAEQVWNIGIVAGVLQPIVKANGLRGVPEEAIWNWDPGAQFGVYLMDTFWLEQN